MELPDLPPIYDQSRAKVFRHKSVTQGVGPDSSEAVSLCCFLPSNVALELRDCLRIGSLVR